MWLFWGLLCLFPASLSYVIDVHCVDDIVAKPLTLLYFYSPNCQYCQNFFEDFQYLSHIYNQETQFQIVRINGRANEELRNLFNVEVYPSFRLYDDVKKQVATFTEERSVENLQLFIREHTGVVPTFREGENKVRKITALEDVEILKQDYAFILIAFIDGSDENWSNYRYPDHFYQAFGRSHPNIAFVVNFFDDPESDLMRIYKVSNIPSLVLVEGDHIGVHNTLSTNPLSNYKLDARDIDSFLSRFRLKLEGTWFEDVQELQAFSESFEFVGHKQRKAGMNYVEGIVRSNMAGLELDEQYQLLLDKISL